MSQYMKDTDKYGKIWIWTAVVAVFMVPVAVCLYYNAWPQAGAVLKGLLGVARIYWTVGVIEVITYTPMLGTGGTYLAFVTGNLTSLKAPSALNAMENADVKPGTEEGEVISTLAIATCSIVTTLVLVLGVCGLTLIAPILNSPVLVPAFDNILPALFGGGVCEQKLETGNFAAYIYGAFISGGTFTGRERGSSCSGGRAYCAGGSQNHV